MSGGLKLSRGRGWFVFGDGRGYTRETGVESLGYGVCLTVECRFLIIVEV